MIFFFFRKGQVVSISGFMDCKISVVAVCLYYCISRMATHNNQQMNTAMLQPSFEQMADQVAYERL